MISPLAYGFSLMMAQAQREVPAMDNGLQDLIVYLCGAAIVGLVVAVITLWREFAAHRLHVAEAYMNTGDVEDMKRDLRELRDIVWKIAAKMDVPTFSENYRR